MARDARARSRIRVKVSISELLLLSMLAALITDVWCALDCIRIKVRLGRSTERFMAPLILSSIAIHNIMHLLADLSGRRMQKRRGGLKVLEESPVFLGCITGRV